MKPLIILFATFTFSIISIKLINKEYNFALAARIAMAIMLVFTAIGHFAFTKGMSKMIPSFIPFKTPIVYLTGIFELLMVLGLLIPKYQYITGWILIIFLLLILPANIYASLNNIDYQKATFDGNGIKYLWFRIPMQIFLIVWVYLSTIRN